MFEVGFFELVVIFGVALVVLGPKRLPGLVAKIGRWLGKARSMARQFQEQLENEVNLEELNRMTEARSSQAPKYPAPPPEFSGEPPPETDTTVPPPEDPSHRDLSDPVYEPPTESTASVPDAAPQEPRNERAT
ncbi:MAG: preprotein translocase subunit TatB [Myxococcaceae bacterium]|nr:preprotein translocase subunit TatB [Myxococcaceae bacterium]